jgi:DNA-binding SARP family transcriptional activator
LLTAAYQICSTCQDHLAETITYQQAYETAVAREHELRLQLITLLKTIAETQSDIAPETGGILFAWPKVEDNSKDKNIPIVEKAKALWHKFQERLLVEDTSRIQETKPIKGETAVQPENVSAYEAVDSPSLVVYCLGVFQVYIDDRPIVNWPNGKGKTIFKYLVTHRELPVAKEVLMELLWPEADPDAARNSLNVAIYSLRQTLRGVDPDWSHILFQDDSYLLNPDMNTWVDTEEFLKLHSLAQTLERNGDLAQAIQQYRAAESLYQGEFIAEDRYDSWIISIRQYIQDAYLDMLERLSHYQSENADFAACITTCLKMLAVDPCREGAHRRLMKCYYLLGQRYLSLRQYHLCVQSLLEELDVPPTEATIDLYQKIRGEKSV